MRLEAHPCLLKLPAMILRILQILAILSTFLQEEPIILGVMVEGAVFFLKND